MKTFLDIFAALVMICFGLITLALIVVIFKGLVHLSLAGIVLCWFIASILTIIFLAIKFKADDK